MAAAVAAGAVRVAVAAPRGEVMVALDSRGGLVWAMRVIPSPLAYSSRAAGRWVDRRLVLARRWVMARR